MAFRPLKASCHSFCLFKPHRVLPQETFERRIGDPNRGRRRNYARSADIPAPSEAIRWPAVPAETKAELRREEARPCETRFCPVPRTTRERLPEEESAPSSRPVRRDPRRFPVRIRATLRPRAWTNEDRGSCRRFGAIGPLVRETRTANGSSDHWPVPVRIRIETGSWIPVHHGRLGRLEYRSSGRKCRSPGARIVAKQGPNRRTHDVRCSNENFGISRRFFDSSTATILPIDLLLHAS